MSAKTNQRENINWRKQEIKRAYERGATEEQLAERFDFCQQRIHDILKETGARRPVPRVGRDYLELRL